MDRKILKSFKNLNKKLILYLIKAIDIPNRVYRVLESAIAARIFSHEKE